MVSSQQIYWRSHYSDRNLAMRLFNKYFNASLLSTVYIFGPLHSACADELATTDALNTFTDTRSVLGDGFAAADESTRWGLGAGVGVSQSPYKSYGTQVSPIPIIYVENKWVRILGPNIDGKLGSIDNFSFTMRARAALGEGYKSSDSTIFHGMNKRSGGVWLGPTVSWDSPIAYLSAEILGDASGNSKGAQATLSASKSYNFGDFEVTPRIATTWLSSNYVNYYYGVGISEAASDRIAYKGKSTVNLDLGVRANYKIDIHQSVLLGIGIQQLGDGITNSSLVDRSTVSELMAGYVYRF